MSITLCRTQDILFSSPLSDEDARQRARVLSALADPIRLRILALLTRYEHQMNVSELVQCFELEQPTISHHLRILLDAGLVDSRKKGLWVYYFVRRDNVHHALANVEQVLQ